MLRGRYLCPGRADHRPGQVGKIEVKISTGHYTNEILKNIRVETNDPEADLVTFTLNAQVVEILKVTPAW